MAQDQSNVLLVANWNSDVGYAWWLMENFWITIARHLEEKHHIECVLIYPEITLIPETIKNSNIKVVECDFRLYTAGNIRTIHSLIKANHIGTVYLTDHPSYCLFYVALRTFGIRCIVVHDHTPGDRTPARTWRKFLKRIIQCLPILTADYFIAVTDFVYQRFLNVACIPQNKCFVAANGIIPIDLSSVDSDYCHRIFNIPHSHSIIVTTGRASTYKGIDFFILCANELLNNRAIDNIHFLFCGDGPDLDYFKRLALNYGLMDHFTFAGNRKDIREILPSCSIGFHASAGEVGYSLSILEYMSAGLITIVPDLPSVCLAIEHGHNGLIYESRNVQDACEAIELALGMPERDMIRNFAINTIKDHLNLGNTNKAMIEIFDTIYNNCMKKSLQNEKS